jgi:hypothetical protein
VLKISREVLRAVNDRLVLSPLGNARSELGSEHAAGTESATR